MSLTDIEQKFIDFCETSGLFGERNNNGADSYTCPSCYESINIKGYCSSTEDIRIINHEDTCALNNMYLLLKEKEL